MQTQPDLASRPHNLSVELTVTLPPSAVFRAWTENLDQWFAAPGTLLMKPVVDSPFFFETRFEGQRHAHYGRYLRIEPDALIELTWVTGNPGTMGAETLLTIEFSPLQDGTSVHLTHAGFSDEESRDGHEKAWPLVFDHLEQCMSKINAS
jgi:uncharacterized protein YndB with AHSA1/START domain